MARLPQPSTVSPGKLNLLYTSAGLEHRLGSYLRSDVDLTDIATISTAADDMAQAWKTLLAPAGNIHGWTITNLDGVTLYSAAFTPPIVGTLDLGSGTQPAQSTSFGLGGRGSAEIGVEGGQTRTEIFPGLFNLTAFQDNKIAIGAGGMGSAVLDFMDTSLVVGADRYGTPASYRPFLTTQINAHYQKRYGV